MHPGLVAQFLGQEWVPRLCGTPGSSCPDPQRLLEERAGHWQSGRFAKAAACAEEAAQLAQETGDAKKLRDALRCAVRDLGDHVVSTHLNETERMKATARIGTHIARLESLDLPKSELALEKALLARLEIRPDDALRYAEAAESEATDPETIADALLVQLQANWQKETPERGLELRDRVQAAQARLVRGDPRLVLSASWLRTLRRAGACRGEDVSEFVGLVRGLVTSSQVPPARALTLIDEVVRDFGRADDLDGASALLMVALDAAIAVPDALR